jgi:hypothetical protein
MGLLAIARKSSIEIAKPSIMLFWILSGKLVRLTRLKRREV